MASVTETIQVSGIRCERCVNRLAGALTGHDGLESANANLMGQVTLVWDDERTSARSPARGDGPGRLPRSSRSRLTRESARALAAFKPFV